MAGGLQLKINAEVRRVSRQLTATERKAVPLAVADAMNRTRDNARTRLVRMLKDHLGIPDQKPLRRRLLKRMDSGARENRLRTTLTYGTFEMAIGDYGEIQETGGGVAVVTKASAYFFGNAFAQTMPDSNHENAWERFGGKQTIKSKPSSQKQGRTYKGQRIAKVTINIARPVSILGRRAISVAFRNVFYSRLNQQLRRHLNRIWR